MHSPTLLDVFQCFVIGFVLGDRCGACFVRLTKRFLKYIIKQAFQLISRRAARPSFSYTVVQEKIISGSAFLISWTLAHFFSLVFFGFIENINLQYLLFGIVFIALQRALTVYLKKHSNFQTHTQRISEFRDLLNYFNDSSH